MPLADSRHIKARSAGDREAARRHLFFEQMLQVIRQRHALLCRQGGKASLDLRWQFNRNGHRPDRCKCIITQYIHYCSMSVYQPKPASRYQGRILR
jgi:hypothetical protein